MSLLSVIIPCHGGVDDTRACVETLLSQQDAPALDIVLVDNASPDDTRDLAHVHDAVRVLDAGQNRGFAGGVNFGVAAARSNDCLILNNDTLAAPHLVARLRAAIATDDCIGMVAPTSNHVKGPARIDVGGAGATPDERAEIERLLADHAAHTPLQDVDTLSGLCLLTRRSTLDRLGGFDERFGPGMFEDDDISLRMRLVGLRLVIARTAFLFHHGHRTFHRLGHDVRETLHDRLECFRQKWVDDPAGCVYLERTAGDPVRAELHADAALDAYPTWPDPHLVLARAARRERNFERVIEHVERFLATSPHHGPAQVLRAIARFALEGAGPGTAALQSALRENYFTPSAAASAVADFGRFLLEENRPEHAMAQLEAAVALDPDATEHKATLGAALLACDRFDRAEPLLRDAALDGSAVASNNLGICVWRRGDTQSAIAHFEKACELAPHDASFRDNLNRARAAGTAPR